MYFSAEGGTIIRESFRGEAVWSVGGRSVFEGYWAVFISAGAEARMMKSEAVK